MSLGSNSIIPLQFTKSYEFDSRWRLNFGNIIKNVCVCVWLKKSTLEIYVNLKDQLNAADINQDCVNDHNMENSLDNKCR